MEEIGFISERKGAHYHNKKVKYNCDKIKIPFQEEVLLGIMKDVPSPEKEKVRVCVRENSKINLTKKSLEVILEHYKGDKDKVSFLNSIVF